MIAAVVNAIAVIIGGSIGLVLKKGISKKISEQVMAGLALCVIAIGIKGSLETNNVLILILSMVIGTVIGSVIDFDQRITDAMHKFENKFFKNKNDNSISQGFIGASLVFCVGSMAVIGSLDAGISGNYDVIFSKSMIDFFAAIIFASTLGVGVVFSSLFVLVYQGTITILATYLAPLLLDVVISEMTGIGSVLIIATGLNILGITNMKLMNYVPAIFLPILLCQFM